jgi:hypothetical protein
LHLAFLFPRPVHDYRGVGTNQGAIHATGAQFVVGNNVVVTFGVDCFAEGKNMFFAFNGAQLAAFAALNVYFYLSSYFTLPGRGSNYAIFFHGGQFWKAIPQGQSAGSVKATELRFQRRKLRQIKPPGV